MINVLTPEQLQNLPKGLTDIYAELSEFVLRDISRRIAGAAKIIDTAEYQMYRARELGLSTKEITEKIANINSVSTEKIAELIINAAEKSNEFDARISYEITEQRSNSFTAEISITNKSDELISGWQLSFKGNFGISSVQNANNLRSENEFRIENNTSDQPIAKGETKKFEFQGVIATEKIPVLSDFVLTSVVPYSDNAQTRMIMCFGAYIEEENSLEIYWFSTDEGAVSLYENTDNGGWEKLAEFTDEKSYKHKITGDFLEKQIKAVQKTSDGTLESEPFIVAHKDGEIVCEWLDSDDDGIADFAEKSFGTDTQKPDTDGDGLTDYEELYITGTNPLKYDTNGNGVNDADDDSDGDGLSNKKEISLGTSPISADTDEDGLSDSEEINKHKTDPLKADSDGDGLNDGEEIAIGLNPNKPETNGMPDSEYRVTQTVSADSEAMSRVNIEESPYELSLEISATGNASTRLSANDSSYSAVTESDARLGGAVELRYLGEVDKVKLTYKIADEYIPNSGGNSEKSLDLQGIKRYNIFRYFEEINMLLPVETKFDEESNTLSAETDELGTYCVLDMEVLMRNFGIEPEEVSTETVTRQMYSAPPAADINTSKSDKYCVTFVIDEREDSIPLQKIKKEINNFKETIEIGSLNVDIQTISQSKMDFWGDYIVITDKLSDVIEEANPSDNNYIFELYSQKDTIFEQNISEELCQKAVEKGINISVFTPFSDELEGYQRQLVDVTGGMIGNGFNEFTDKNIYEYVFGEKYVAREYLHAILASGYQKITLDTLLYPNGENPSGVDSDTDKDGLTDWDETYNELLTFDESGRCILPTVNDCMRKLGDVPFYVEDYMSRRGIASIYGKSRVLPIRSDPTNEDSDRDELNDVKEFRIGTKPLNSDTDGDMLSDGEEIYIGTIPFFTDTDGDGLSDYREVDLWFDPLNANPDGDSFNDYDEWKNGTNPYVYDYTPEDWVLEFLKGAGLGDWETADNIPQLVGQIIGSLVPFIADARDYFANIFKNRDTLAALMNLGGFLADLATYGGDIATNIAKAASKLGKFISKNADDAPKVIDAITQVSKQLSKGDEALSAVVKNLDAKTLNQIEDLLKNTKNITKKDFFKYIDILKAAGRNADEILAQYYKGAKLPLGESQLKHIFADREGHIIDTLENRRLIESVANDANLFVGVSDNGLGWFSKIQDDGSQVWVKVFRNDTTHIISDGGLIKFHFLLPQNMELAEIHFNREGLR